MTSISVLAAFNGSNGKNPSGSLVSDAAGNLYGTTQLGGTADDGTVFEIAKTASGYAPVPTLLASFSGTDGNRPEASLTIDADGNLYGTTAGGGTADFGTVFEIAKTASGYASSPTTIVSFHRTDGAGPFGSLVSDVAGNLYGTTSFGGSSEAGTVFEIAKTASGHATTPTALASFSGTNGLGPRGSLILDAAGNLYGTTFQGGPQYHQGGNGVGTVFEIEKTASGYSSTPTNLASFEANYGNPSGDLIADAAGNLYGTVQQGGPTNSGAIFEVAKTASGYASTPTIVANFTDGYTPYGSLTADAAGNFYGTTERGGASNDGTVFELAKTATGFATTPTTLASFNDSSGYYPTGSLITDVDGSLFGTAQSGGPTSNNGTVFEVSNTPFVVCFCEGTRIRTGSGEVAVENLNVGDLVVTTSEVLRPIRWLGHRTIDCRRHRSQEVMPVRIAAHAFGEERPACDLRVSPGHAICVDLLGEVLIPAGALVNGSTIVQEEIDVVTYWHVELEGGHDILFAENLPCESYLEMDNRGFFAESGVVDLEALPDAPVVTHADFCRPFHSDGRVVNFVRERLAARASDLGWTLADEPLADLHLVVDGRRMDPHTHGLAARILVPADAEDVWLVSNTSVPAEIGMEPDLRRLGVCVGALVVDDGFGTPQMITPYDPRLCVGFHHAEEGPQRWTSGRARLPADLWEGCRGSFFLRVELTRPALSRWVAPSPRLRGSEAHAGRTKSS